MLSGNENVEPKIVKIGSYSAKDLIPTINLEISRNYNFGTMNFGTVPKFFW